MKIHGNDRTLESFKIFPYVAWAITVGFSIFVYNIALELKTVTEDLQKQTQFLQERVQTPVEAIDTFEQQKPPR
jgi:hypothetical protein